MVRKRSLFSDMAIFGTFCRYFPKTFFDRLRSYKSIRPTFLLELDHNILPGKLTCPLKINGWKMHFLLKLSLFRGHVSFQGCTHAKTRPAIKAPLGLQISTRGKDRPMLSVSVPALLQHQVRQDLEPQRWFKYLIKYPFL